MTIRHISPTDAFAMLSRGASLVDIREPGEWQQENIPMAALHPLSQIAANPPAKAKAVIFHCKSGARTTMNAPQLAATVPGAEVWLLEGGIDAWRRAGLPVRPSAARPQGVLGGLGAMFRRAG
jgi:rhodanese-related sulfurtransferase